ncbi:MAG: TonB-dependent receptor plug domain-containing protein [Bacteroidia bacterium]|nr:TonB-dependent receptor plug domain-containing protein [Bacteroidia bacterium]
MKKVLIFIISFFIFSIANSQIDTFLYKNLDEITISESRIQLLTQGNRKDAIDSIFNIYSLSLPISQLLNTTGSINIRSYGPGSLATSTLRGGNSYQTSISWNGISINNPVNGLCDFNLIPAFMFDEIFISPGLPSSIQGSGSIGGGINLQNNTNFKKKNDLDLFQSFGSFSQYTAGLKTDLSYKKIKNTLKLFYSTSKNNYSFTNFNEQGFPKQNMTNANTTLFSVLNELKIFSSKRGIFKVLYWGTAAQRQIPPTILMSSSVATQSDNLNKVSSGWEKSINKVKFKVYLILQKDYLKYKDLEQNINSITNNNTITSDIEIRYRQCNISNWNFGFSGSRTVANVESKTITDTIMYNNSSRNQISLWISNILKFKKINTEISTVLRQEYVDDKFIPLVPSVGYKTSINKHFYIFGQWSRVYRIPTLNDLYWNPGGNKNLKSESGIQAEQSMGYNHKSKNIEINPVITVFSKVINNQIQWQPVSSQIWKPFNISKVYSRGIELRNNFKFKICNNLWSSSGINLNLIKSENINKSDNNFGNQIIYVPYYNSSVFVGFILKKITFNLINNSVGSRYTSTDNTEFLKGYSLFNLFFNRTFINKKIKIDLYFKANNIFNTSYQEVAWRPMPGRNYEVGINLNFKKK